MNGMMLSISPKRLVVVLLMGCCAAFAGCKKEPLSLRTHTVAVRFQATAIPPGYRGVFHLDEITSNQERVSFDAPFDTTATSQQVTYTARLSTKTYDQVLVNLLLYPLRPAVQPALGTATVNAQIVVDGVVEQQVQLDASTEPMADADGLRMVSIAYRLE